MDELIYGFLLQSGYPRAAVVDDLSLLPLAGADGGRPNGDAPAFAIVDPDTADRLAVIDGVGAVDGDELRARAASLGRYARRFGGRSVQAFIVRVDFSAPSLEARVRFYRVWPNESLQRLSAKTFPDLASLRTRQLLVERRELSAPDGESVDADDFGYDADPDAYPDPAPAPGMSRTVWLPGAVLVLCVLADALAASVRGEGLFSVVQAVLLVGAAALLLVPALARSR